MRCRKAYAFVRRVARLRILLIMPNAGIHRLKVGPFRMSFREAPLTLTTLAALVPPELKADIKIVDESVDDVPFDEHFDLVGISCLTGTALRAYEIAGYYRARGATVVLGGVHVSLRPDEAARHADIIVKGFGEQSWKQLLRDFQQGNCQRIYESHSVDLRGIPDPKRNLQRRLGYIMPNTVFASRGCRRTCDFCTVPAAGFGWHTRPVGEVIEEIRGIRSRRFVFNDVNMTEDRDYICELLTALIPLKKKWGGLASVDVALDDEVLELMRRSGCVYLLTGFETLAASGLHLINKGFNEKITYSEAMGRFHSKGILIQGCFIFGLDHDRKDVFDLTVNAVNELRVDIPRFAIYTPYPETEAFRRLKREGRIIHECWHHYDTQHVVFRPLNMTAEELDEGFRKAYRDAFSISCIVRRTSDSKHFLMAFLGNLAYRLYVRRLNNDPKRLLQDIVVGETQCRT